ncbi:MAG TPA: hypothetical protein VKQ72_13810 [Aggregatilineales bacterium]|nr:hypothetical protein [Aggregatilineales bacterium]
MSSFDPVPGNKAFAKSQAVKTTPLRPHRQAAAIAALVMVVAVIIGALYLAQATTTATTGAQLQELQSTRDYLQRANEDTSAQIAADRNISVLRGRAQALGFVPVTADKLQYLVVAGYSPYRATPTPVVTPEIVYVYDETFGGWVQQQWNTLTRQFEAWSGRSQPTPTPIP